MRPWMLLIDTYISSAVDSALSGRFIMIANLLDGLNTNELSLHLA